LGVAKFILILGDNSMSNLFIDWAIDQAIDKAMVKAEYLKSQNKILNDDEIDRLTTEEFDKIMEENNGAS